MINLTLSVNKVELKQLQLINICVEDSHALHAEPTREGERRICAKE